MIWFATVILELEKSILIMYSLLFKLESIKYHMLLNKSLANQ